MHPPVRKHARGTPYVCMPGSPYTGSTLLGLLLNCHDSCASVGAATGLTSRVDIATYRCSCGARFRDCIFWNRVRSRTVELGHPVDIWRSNFWSTHVRMSRRRWLNGLLVRSLGNVRLTEGRDAVANRVGPMRAKIAESRSSTATLARAVLDVTGKAVFVDTARDHQRPKYLAPAPQLDLRIIHLVRDPRGNVASIMRHTGADVEKAARQWTHYNLEADRVRRYVDPKSWMTLHYEELCANPQAALDRVARHIGVDPAPLPPDLQKTEHHIIGNSMRLKTIDGIELDERWRTELRRKDLATISRIAGDASHRLGYGWP